MKLSAKEKLFLFTIADDLRQNILKPKYSPEITDISEKEFDAMAADKRLRYKMIRFLEHAAQQHQSYKRRVAQMHKIENGFKDTILVDIHNDLTVHPELDPIKPTISGILDKYLSDKNVTDEDFEKLWTFETDDRDIELTIQAVTELFEGKRKLRRCAADDCNMIFIPKLKTQIYHSDKCRKRMWARKNNN